MNDHIVVRDGGVLELQPHRDAIPTPMLVSVGRGEAYHVPSDDPNWPAGHWRLRDDDYDPPGTVYTRVRVIRNSEGSTAP